MIGDEQGQLLVAHSNNGDDWKDMPSPFMDLVRPHIEEAIEQAQQTYPLISRVTQGEKFWFEEPGRRVQFEFGDFRVEAETTQTQLLIEVDSTSLDITNLVKYWYMLDRHFTHHGVRARKVILLHIYRQCETNQERSGQNYFSRVQLWEYLYPIIRERLNGRFEATKHPFTPLGKIVLSKATMQKASPRQLKR